MSSSGNPGNCLELNWIDEFAEGAQHPAKARLFVFAIKLGAYVLP
jgi:hypothetical protein